MADNSLLAGYIDQVPNISTSQVKRAVAEMEYVGWAWFRKEDGKCQQLDLKMIAFSHLHCQKKKEKKEKQVFLLSIYLYVMNVILLN